MLLKPLHLALLIAPFLSCDTGKEKKYKSNTEAPVTVQEATASAYDLLHPSRKWTLPKDELKEISGLAWIDKNHFLVIEDLHPNLYLIRMESSGIIEKTIPFKQTEKDKFDIEDVAVVNNTAYALWSHGVVFKISDWNKQPEVKKYPTELSKENNTEGLCYDPVTKHLLIACKNESEASDEKKSTRAIYEFDQDAGTLKPEPFLLIHKKDFKKLADEKLEFFPSAVAVHPATHDIYILSTKETKCMAVYNRQGELKSFHPIDKELMPQPEGICFSPDGTLYISTQGRHGESPMIYEFKQNQ